MLAIEVLSVHASAMFENAARHVKETGHCLMAADDINKRQVGVACSYGCLSRWSAPMPGPGQLHHWPEELRRDHSAAARIRYIAGLAASNVKPAPTVWGRLVADDSV